MLLDTITLQIATITVELNLPPADITDEALDRYAPFMLIGDEIKPDIKLNIALTDGLRKSETFENETVTIERTGGALIIKRDDLTAQLDQAAGVGSATIHPSVYTLDSLLRIIYSTQLPLAGGLLLHSSGVIRDNLAHVFIGPSESGKTTAASYSPPGCLLSDELTAAHTGEQNTPLASGTPFMGELNTGSVNKTAPVAALYFLNRTGPPGLTKLTATAAITKTLACALNFDNSPQTAAALLDNAINLCSNAKLRQLCYNKNENLWDIIGNDNI